MTTQCVVRAALTEERSKAEIFLGMCRSDEPKSRFSNQKDTKGRFP